MEKIVDENSLIAALEKRMRNIAELTSKRLEGIEKTTSLRERLFLLFSYMQQMERSAIEMRMFINDFMLQVDDDVLWFMQELLNVDEGTSITEGLKKFRSQTGEMPDATQSTHIDP